MLENPQIDVNAYKQNLNDSVDGENLENTLQTLGRAIGKSTPNRQRAILLKIKITKPDLDLVDFVKKYAPLQHNSLESESLLEFANHLNRKL